ncbi:GNAT family N-acetyltransferase [Legionella cardiaca]|uniref:GNAT family protein n=1 Tax=Legionella cardiaca TaxID=1071983 RepID=A0ABY8AQL3_9GAMM|nr:GNAT family protein [Legionella cardiaca]WED42980.1 GNAT family protein [Legionella cardiaca]
MKVKYNSKRIGNISISKEENFITICSGKLIFRSLNQYIETNLLKDFTALLGNLKNVELFRDGKVWDSDKIQELIQSEIKKWDSGEQFCSFAIHHAQSKQFAGILFISHLWQDYAKVGAGHENVGEIGYVLDEAFWGKGLGTEIAIIGKKYIKFVITQAQANTPASSIKEIVATVHPQNIGSAVILKKTLKHQEPEEITKFGGQPRLFFFKPLKPANMTAIADETVACKL